MKRTLILLLLAGFISSCNDDLKNVDTKYRFGDKIFLSNGTEGVVTSKYPHRCGCPTNELTYEVTYYDVNDYKTSSRIKESDISLKNVSNETKGYKEANMSVHPEEMIYFKMSNTVNALKAELNEAEERQKNGSNYYAYSVLNRFNRIDSIFKSDVSKLAKDVSMTTITSYEELSRD